MILFSLNDIIKLKETIFYQKIISEVSKIYLQDEKSIFKNLLYLAVCMHACVRVLFGIFM